MSRQLAELCEHGRMKPHTYHVNHRIRVGPIGSDISKACDPEDCDSSFAWEECPGGRLVGATPIPWCKTHESRFYVQNGACGLGLETQEVKLCQLEDPPEHYRIEASE